MGWLFAVAIGLQERSLSDDSGSATSGAAPRPRAVAALLRALPPIAAGHAASVLVVAGLVGVFQSVLATRLVAIGGGAVLVGFGLWRALSQRHFRWAGMRLSAAQLVSWSFLMSSVHGAGLMLLPVLVAGPTPAGGHHHGAAAAGASLWTGLGATTVHTVAMVAVAGAVALVVYEVVGLRILRTAWVNLDRVWAYALVGAGVATIATAVTS
nr:hypothetical protein [Planosporangium mesophilum]